MQQDLKDLAGEADLIDSQAAPVSAEPAQPAATVAATDPAAEAGDVIRFGVALFVPLYPSLATVYSDAQQERLAQATAPLLAKYGITMGGLFERWGPEINFLIVAGPLAMETAKAIRLDSAARRAKPEPGSKPEPAQPATPAE